MPAPRFPRAPATALRTASRSVARLRVLPAAGKAWPLHSSSTHEYVVVHDRDAPGKVADGHLFGLGPSNEQGLDNRGAFDYATSPGAAISDHVAMINISAQPLTLLLYGTDATDSSTDARVPVLPSFQHTGASHRRGFPRSTGAPDCRQGTFEC